MKQQLLSLNRVKQLVCFVLGLGTAGVVVGLHREGVCPNSADREGTVNTSSVWSLLALRSRVEADPSRSVEELGFRGELLLVALLEQYGAVWIVVVLFDHTLH